MEIFYLARTIEPGRTSYDQMIEAVVIAAGEEHARRIASFDAHAEGADAWFTPSVTVTKLGDAAPGLDRARVICSDVNEG